MDSAFGIDHGDVSKAGGMPRQRKRVKAAQKAELEAIRLARAQQLRGKLKAVSGLPGKAANAKISVADVGSGAGKSVAAVGRLATARPGVTGAALIGGGGYLGYRAVQKPDLPKRKRQ